MDTMATQPNDVRRSILRRLREELEAEVALATNSLDVLTRYLDQMGDRGPEMIRMESLQIIPLSTTAQIRRIFLDGYGVLVVRT
ncbi:hypothetical protein Tco_1336645 [Tanacetum coccineum]